MNLTLPSNLDGIVPFVPEPNMFINDTNILSSINSSITLKTQILHDVTPKDPNTFRPQDPTYYSDLIKRGTPFWIILAMVFFWSICYTVGRLVLGRCGGRNSKPIGKLARFDKWFPFGFEVAGAALFAIFGTMYLISGIKVSHYLNIVAEDINYRSAHLNNLTTDINFIIGSINDQKLAIPNDTINETLPFYIQSSMKKVQNETLTGIQNSDQFESYFNETGPSYKTFPILMYIFSIIFLACTFLVFKYRLGAFSFYLNYGWLLLCMLSLLLGGVNLYDLTMYGDVCDQTYKAATKNLLPPYGEGINYYLTCLSSAARRDLGAQQFDLERALYAGYLIYLDRAAEVDPELNVTTTQDVIVTYPKMSDQILKDYGSIVEQLSNAIKDVEMIHNCEDLKEFVIVSNTNLCYYGLKWIYITLLALIWLSFAYGILSYGTAKAANILTKVKEIEGSHVTSDYARAGLD